MNNNPVIPSVDYIVLSPCNMRCKYCFATFNDLGFNCVTKNQLSKEDSLRLVKKFAKKGFKKITFLGGEPLLCPWIMDLIKNAKQEGLITCLTTNGVLVTDKKLDFFKEYLDWITLSIDSVDRDTLIKIGRAVNNKPLTQERYQEIIEGIKKRNIKFKINTVVSLANYKEDITSFIKKTKPPIWKLLQVLPMQGQNDALINDFVISKNQFDKYVKRAIKVEKDNISVKVVNNEVMPASYVLVDPLGRLIDTFDGKYQYSQPILEIGIDKALSQTRVMKSRFIKRGGVYEW